MRPRRSSDISSQRARLATLALVVALATLVLAAAAPSPAVALFCDAEEGPPANARFTPIGGVATNRGAFVYEVADIPGDGRPGSSFVRDYDGSDARLTPMGPGWKHHYDIRLAINGDSPDDMLFSLHDHRVEHFVDGWFEERTTGTNIPARVLTRAIDGTWTVEDGETTWHFSSQGQVTSLEVQGRGTASFEYEGGLLARVIGVDGPTIAVEFGPNGQLESVENLQDPQESVTYEYDDLRRLVRVERSDGTVEAYTYDGDSERVATVEDGAGNVRLSLEYDAEHRVVSEKDAAGLVDGQAVTFEYETFADGSSRTIATYPESRVEPGWHPIEEHTYDRRGWLVESRHRPTSEEEFVGRYSYGADGRRVVEQDPCEGFVPQQAAPPPRDPLLFIIESIARLFARFLPPEPHPDVREASSPNAAAPRA